MSCLGCHQRRFSCGLCESNPEYVINSQGNLAFQIDNTVDCLPAKLYGQKAPMSGRHTNTISDLTANSDVRLDDCMKDGVQAMNTLF